MEKMTYTAALSNAMDSLRDIPGTEQTIARLTDLYASLVKRSSYKSTKPSKASREASKFAETVYNALDEGGEPKMCGEIAKELDVSGQKVSAALTKLVKAGRVEKHVEKGKSWFIIAGPDMDE